MKRDGCIWLCEIPEEHTAHLLLDRHLSPAQRTEWRYGGKFTVRGGWSGGRYIIDPGGGVMFDGHWYLCSTESERTTYIDEALAKLLLIQADEQLFLANAFLTTIPVGYKIRMMRRGEFEFVDHPVFVDPVKGWWRSDDSSIIYDHSGELVRTHRYNRKEHRLELIPVKPARTSLVARVRRALHLEKNVD